MGHNTEQQKRDLVKIAGYCQCLIELLDEAFYQKYFNQNLKQSAKNFHSILLKKMSVEFDTSAALDQLVDITSVMESVMNLSLSASNLDRDNQEKFMDDLEAIFEKYGLDH